jgi:hypothetical protein
MTYQRFICLLAVVLILGLVSGCSKDKSTEPNESAPQFVPKTVTVPQAMQQSSDQMAQMSMSYISMANAMSNFASYFTPPPLAKSNGGLDATGWEKKWQEDGMTVTLTASENDTGFQWIVKLDGTSLSEGTTFNDFTFLQIEQNENGTAGQFILFDFVNNTSEMAIHWVWTNYPGNPLYFVCTFYDDGVPDTKLEITSNPDKSGELKFYEYINNVFVLDFHTSWTATGSGAWWSYDNLGNITDQGTWG